MGFACGAFGGALAEGRVGLLSPRLCWLAATHRLALGPDLSGASPKEPAAPSSPARPAGAASSLRRRCPRTRAAAFAAPRR